MLSKINVIPIIKYMTYTRLLCIKSCKGMVKKLICVYAWGGVHKMARLLHVCGATEGNKFDFVPTAYAWGEILCSSLQIVIYGCTLRSNKMLMLIYFG